MPSSSKLINADNDASDDELWNELENEIENDSQMAALREQRMEELKQECVSLLLCKLSVLKTF